jgi:hypothetical protein
LEDSGVVEDWVTEKEIVAADVYAARICGALTARADIPISIACFRKPVYLRLIPTEVLHAYLR